MEKLTLPKKGLWYFAYDDGKINMARICKVKILSVIPFDKASKSLIKDWKSDFKQHSPLNQTTPCFIRVKEIGSDEPPVYFAKKSYGNCFYSFQRQRNHYFDANLLLDSDGHFTRQIISDFKEALAAGHCDNDPDCETESKELNKDYSDWKKQFKDSGTAAS